MKKKIVALFIAAIVISSLTVSALAAAPLDINGVLKTAFEECVASILGSIGVVLPIALPVLGVTMAIAFAIKFFRKVTAKAG